MGGKSTRLADTGDLLQSKFLKESLQRGSPPPSVSSQPGAFSSPPPLLDPHDFEVQRAYLEQLVECTPEAISILDRKYHITRVNSEFTRMFGFSAEEAVGGRVNSLIVPPDRNTETRWMGEVLASGEKISLETKRQRKDGSLVDVFVSAAPVMVGGVQTAAYILYRDISSQKQAEALSSALYRIAQKTSSAENLQRFYAAIHKIVGELMYARNFYIALHDPNTGLLNFPYYVDEKNPPPAPRKMDGGLTEYVLRTGEPLLCTPEIFEELAKRRDVGPVGIRSLDWLGAPLKAAGVPIGVVAVQSYNNNVRFRLQDKEILTIVSQQIASAIEHKRNEDELRCSEARYRSLVQSAVYGIYRLSLEGRFLDVNPALVAMLGYSLAEDVLLLDVEHDVFVSPEECSRVMREFYRNTHLENVEVHWKRKDGSHINVRLSGRAVNRPEESGQVLEGIAEDVTERRVLEEQFRQAQRMEAVGRLAGGVAHDFNNLLMVVSGYTEILLDNTAHEDPLHPKLEAIQQAARRASSLTRQLLAFSRRQVLELKVVDINQIVSGIERLLRPLIGENTELCTRLAHDLGRTRADAGQIEQVIMNLVVNSKDAMPGGGKITIHTSNVNLGDNLRRQFSFVKPGPYIMLSIKDTGYGMDKETQSRIFEPFFTTKEKGKGTGLGLSTVYGIIKQSGGYIFAQSEPGHGATFRIYLPRVTEAADPMDMVCAFPSHTRGTETVLLVEDEDSVRLLVRETLESRGYKILEAENGDVALKIAATHQGRVHMLITDVVMPGMSGHELSRKIFETFPATKVLYLSGYSEDVALGVQEIGTAFLQKPFTLQELARKVREVLNSESQ